MTQDTTQQDISLRERLEIILSDLEEIEIEFENKGYSITGIDMTIRSLYRILEDEAVEW